MARLFTIGLLGATLATSGANANGSEVPTPEPTAVTTPSFGKHVVPLFNRMGCSARECHGAFQGQHGFRLSLFGYDLALDHAELLETDSEENGSRIDTVSPRKSLALLKPLEKIDHEGGKKFEDESWQFRILHDWIAAGAPYDPETEPYLERIEITPPELRLAAGDGKAVALRATAHFSDGTHEDVTRFAAFSSNDESVARVSKDGAVVVAGVGDTHIVSSYAGGVVTTQVLVPREDDGVPFPRFKAKNRIDKLVAAKLRKVGIRPSGPCTDAAFLRRAYVDAIGTLPTPEEARRFIEDGRPGKRARLVDELLDRPEYALYWATLFSDLTGNNRQALNPNFKVQWLWYDWLRDKFANNLPYDEFVRGIMTATSREGRSLEEYKKEIDRVYGNIKPYDGRKHGFDDDTYARRKTLDLYWMRRGGTPEMISVRSANTFLGLQIQCAQCHKHPFDRWTQDDFESFTSFFRITAVRALDGSPRGNRYDYQSVAVYPGYHRNSEGNVKKYPPKILGGPVVPFEEGGDDPRVTLWEWMVAPDNPYFARNIVNRLWGHYFGAGIVDPVDDFNAANPPSNPQLLDWLARDFIVHDFDLKHVHRRILNSRTYQTSHLPNETNRTDKRNFSHALVKRMQAEVLMDAIADVTGISQRYSSTFVPPDTRAIGLAPATTFGSSTPEYAMKIFGRPKREQTCACERTTAAALSQALFLINDSDVLERIADPEGKAASLLAEIPGDEELIEELYLLCLSRHPRPAETQKILKYFDHEELTREEAVEDVMWSLMNVREFLFVR